MSRPFLVFCLRNLPLLFIFLQRFWNFIYFVSLFWSMQHLKSAFVLCELWVEVLFQMDIILHVLCPATFVEKMDFFPFNYFDNFTKTNQNYMYNLLLYTILFHVSILQCVLISHFSIYSSLPCHFLGVMIYLETCCLISKYVWIFQAPLCFWYLL